MSHPPSIWRLALLAGLAASTGAHAAYTATATVDTVASTAVNLGFNSGHVDDPLPLMQTTSSSTPLSATQSASSRQLFTGLTLSGGASAQVTVSPGSIQLSGAAGGSTQANPGGGPMYNALYAQADSKSTGSFAENVVWQVAGLAPGTPIYLDYSVRLAGSAGAGVTSDGATASGLSDGGAGVSYQWIARLGPGGLLMSGARSLSAGVGGAGQNTLAFGDFGATGYVTLGQPELLSMWADVTTAGRGFSQCTYCDSVVNGTGSASGNFQPGLTWNGITGARLFDNTPIDLSRLSAMSDSGFNYVSAVPEPSSGFLLTLGLVAWTVMRRRMVVSPRSGALSTQAC